MAVDCDKDVSIYNAEDARKLRESCTTINGDLQISVNETINLDGIETVKGTLRMSGSCGDKVWHDDSGDCTPPFFSLSSSTLKNIEGGLRILEARSLEKILLPNLESVLSDRVELDGLPDLTHLDITNLETIYGMLLNLTGLKTLELKGLKRHTVDGYLHEDDASLVYLISVGEIDSVDAFFQNNVVSADGKFNGTLSVDLYASAMPKVRHITMGWENLGTVRLAGELNVTLGGPDSESINVVELGICDTANVVVERSSHLKSLSVEIYTRGVCYEGLGSGPSIEHLTLPFDQLSNLSLAGWPSLQSVQLPPEAENWKNFDLFIYNCSMLNLSSEYNAENKKTWYWPKYDMAQLEIYANASDAFL